MQGFWALFHITFAAAGAWTAGRLVIGRYWPFEQKSVQIAAETASGLLLLSHLIFILSIYRMIHHGVLFLLLGSLVLLAVIGTMVLKKTSPPAAPRAPFQKGFFLLLAVPAAVYLTFIIMNAVLPSSDRDELIYHLEIPRQFLAHGGLTAFQDNIYGYFPQLGEMLFLFGLGTSGELAARFYHIIGGGLLALALYGYSRKFLNEKNSFLAVLVFLSAPVVTVILPLAYVDLLFSLYAFLGLVCLLYFFKTDKLRWTVLSGIFAGACMATKYTGIQILVLLVCLSLLEHLSRRRRGLPVSACLLAAAAMPVFLPYLWRNWALTGWPLFPFTAGNFTLHSGINWDAERARLYLGWLGTFGAPIGGQTIGHILLAPVLVFITAQFNNPQFYEGILGPVFLLAPLLLLLDRGKKPKEFRWLIIFSVLFLYYWAFTTKQSRFLIPLLPVFSFLLVYGLSSLRKKVLYALTASLIGFNFFAGTKEVLAKNPFPFWFAGETRDRYLARQLPVYPIYQEANKHLGPGDRLYLINMKNYVYYLDMPVRADFVFERYRLDRALENSLSVETVSDFFKSQNISHLLIDEGFVFSPEWGMPAGHQAVFRQFLARQARPVFRDSRYVLYRLAEPDLGTS
jgi:hypothetical protein